LRFDLVRAGKGLSHDPEHVRQGKLAVDDIRLPASAAVFEFGAASFDKEAPSDSSHH
jgi:hypothetical protein